MGVPGLWRDFLDVPETTLAEYARDFYATNFRHPRVAIDLSIFLYELSEVTKGWGHTNFHRQFIRRIAAMQATGIRMVAVFDGPSTQRKLRHSYSRRRLVHSHVLLYMRQCLDAMGVPSITAACEAEAQCCELQMRGGVDAVFSSDTDVFCLGASTVIRFAPVCKNQQNRNTDAHDDDASPKTSDKGALLRPIQVVKIDPETQRWEFILRAILVGNDFSSGIENIGVGNSARIANPATGFASELRNCYHHEPWNYGKWLERLRDELQTNRHNYMRKKLRNAVFPENFPDVHTLKQFADPSVRSDYNIDLIFPQRINKSKLRELWMGASPLKCKAPKGRVGAERDRKMTSEQEFENTISGAVLATAIQEGKDCRTWYRRVHIQNPSTVVDIHLYRVGPWANITRYTRVAEHVARLSVHPIFNPDLLKYSGNLRLDSFLSTRQATEANQAAHGTTAPACSDTEDDEEVDDEEFPMTVCSNNEADSALEQSTGKEIVLGDYHANGSLQECSNDSAVLVHERHKEKAENLISSQEELAREEAIVFQEAAIESEFSRSYHKLPGPEPQISRPDAVEPGASSSAYVAAAAATTTTTTTDATPSSESSSKNGFSPGLRPVLARSSRAPRAPSLKADSHARSAALLCSMIQKQQHKQQQQTTRARSFGEIIPLNLLLSAQVARKTQSFSASEMRTLRKQPNQQLRGQLTVTEMFGKSLGSSNT